MVEFVRFKLFCVEYGETEELLVFEDTLIVDLLLMKL